MLKNKITQSLVIGVASFVISACGGGGSSNEAPSPTPNPPPPPANVAPTANAGVDQTANEESVVTLTGSGTDTDGTVAKYEWTQTSGPNVTFENYMLAVTDIAIPNIDKDEILSFELKVTDNDGATHVDIVNIDVTYINDVDILTEIESNAIISQLQDSFTVSDSSVLSSKNIGDIVVADVSNNLPNGLFAKITEKTSSNGITTFSYEQAGLKEVIQEGELSISKTFEPSDFTNMQTTPAPLGVKLYVRNNDATYSPLAHDFSVNGNVNDVGLQQLKKYKSIVSFKNDIFQGCDNPEQITDPPAVVFVLENVGLYQNTKDINEEPKFDTGALKLHENEDYKKIVSVDGCLGFNIGYDFIIDFNLFASDHYLFTTKPQQYGELEIVGKLAEAELKLSKELHKWVLPRIKFLIGVVPVWITPEITINWGLDAGAEANIFTGVTEYASVTYGIEYRENRLSPVLDTDFDFNFQPPTVALSAKAESFIGPNLALKIYDLIGPNADFQIYANALVQNENPWWRIGIGARAGAGIKVEILDKEIEELSFSIPDILDREIVSWQAQSPLLGIPINISAQATQNSVNLTWDSVPNATGYIVYYGLEPNLNISSEQVETSENSFFISSLESNTTYYFAVAAGSDDTSSQLSPEISITTEDGSDSNSGDFNQGLVAYYPFNGNANDVSGNGYHGTARGDASFEGNVLNLDGNGDYVETQSISEAWNNWTISVFVKTEDLATASDSYEVVERERIGEFNDLELVLRQNDGKIRLENDRDPSITTDANVIDGRWIHIVVNYDGSTRKVYVNGVLDKQVASNNSAINVNAPLNIGYHLNPNAPLYFKGQIDELRVYDRALSSAEVHALYSQDKPDDDPVSQHPFDGTWSLTGTHTSSGDSRCEVGETRTVEMTITNGSMSTEIFGGLAVNGSVSENGNISAVFSRSEVGNFGTFEGTLTSSNGSGTYIWSDPVCSGRWTATKQ